MAAMTAARLGPIGPQATVWSWSMRAAGVHSGPLLGGVGVVVMSATLTHRLVDRQDVHMTQPQLPLPNPDDWIDINQACELLQRARPTVYDMLERGVLNRHVIGSRTLLWRAEVAEVAAALRLLEARAPSPDGPRR